jgi:spore maturation protein SpmA
MALSRIWSAFIIVSMLVAIYKFASGDETVFSRMVTGKASDVTDSVSYTMIGSPEKYNTTTTGFTKLLDSYGYKKDSISKSKILITDDVNADSVSIIKAANPGIKIYTFKSVQSILRRNNDGIIETCKTAVTISIGLIGIMALFMGFMNIAERAGGIRLLSRITAPFFSELFPELPKGHPAMGHMMMNFSANLLGLDNAATPFGIKAMESLQQLNPAKERASNSQIMFLCLHASGLTLIPVTIIATRSAMKATNPTDIFIPCMITTFVATIFAMMIVALKQRINIFKPVIIAWIGGLLILITFLVYYLHSLSAERLQVFSGILGNGILLLILFLIVAGAVYKKINLFDAFIEGAKGGFETAIRIIPYLVGLLVAISLLRTSGTFDVVINAMRNFFSMIFNDTRFVDGLPTAIIRPLSGSGARGMMVDTMNTFGPNSFAAKLSGIMQGSSDTTFYVVALYFGAVSIKNTRYAIGAMLLADLAGIITSIILAYLFFGNSA